MENAQLPSEVEALKAVAAATSKISDINTANARLLEEVKALRAAVSAAPTPIAPPKKKTFMKRLFAGAEGAGNKK